MSCRDRKAARRHWCCATCGAVLGSVRSSAEGRYLFAAPQLHGAVRRDAEPGAWTLTCADGHETEWRGAGINWWATPVAA